MSKGHKAMQWQGGEESDLPHNFAQMVMELEMQMEFEESSSLEVVQQLNELYRLAIEHYINDDPRKLAHFQRKLTTLLTHPRTLQAIQNKSEPANPSLIYSRSLKQELGKFNSEAGILVKSMMEGLEIKAQYSSRLVNQNIENQEKSLKMRLMRRSSSRSSQKGLR